MALGSKARPSPGVWGIALWMAIGGASAGVARGDTTKGPVVRVADGDTVVYRFNDALPRARRRPMHLRLFGVDCPELGQPFGEQAKKRTIELVFGKTIEVHPVTVDRYGRVVARVFFFAKRGAGPGATRVRRSLGEALVEAGLAWWYRKYAPKDRRLAALEAEARRAGRGLWSEPKPRPPWKWRAERRARRKAAKRDGRRGCYRKCLDRSRARAVAAWQIKADCRASCARRRAGVNGASKGALHGNIRSKVFHAPGCADYRCKRCTKVFASPQAARRAGYRPHARCTGAHQ